MAVNVRMWFFLTDKGITKCGLEEAYNQGLLNGKSLCHVLIPYSCQSIRLTAVKLSINGKFAILHVPWGMKLNVPVYKI